MRRQRILLLFICFILLGMVVSGCQKKQSDQALNTQTNVIQPDMTQPNVASNGDVTILSPDQKQNQFQKNPQGSGGTPHSFGDFQGDGAEFKGGNEVSNYNLSTIRRADNPVLVRLIFDFSIGDSSQAGSLPPVYAVKLSDNAQKLRVELGIAKADVIQDKKGILGLSEFIKDVSYQQTGKNTGVMELTFKTPVACEVFALENPARIAVVLRPLSGSSI